MVSEYLVEFRPCDPPRYLGTYIIRHVRRSGRRPPSVISPTSLVFSSRTRSLSCMKANLQHSDVLPYGINRFYFASCISSARVFRFPAVYEPVFPRFSGLLSISSAKFRTGAWSGIATLSSYPVSDYPPSVMIL